MQCMLDTDTCVYLIKKAPGLKPQSALEDCYISTIVLGELEYGVANSAKARRDQNRQALLDFISAIQILSLTETVSETYGELRAARYLLIRQAGDSRTRAPHTTTFRWRI